MGKNGRLLEGGCMARHVKEPHVLPRSSVMSKTVELPHVDELTLKVAYHKAFPFPAEALVFGYELIEKTAKGFKVKLFAFPREKAEPFLLQGLAVENILGQSPIWMIRPPRQNIPKKGILISLTIFVAISASLQTINTNASKRLTFLQKQQSKHVKDTAMTAFLSEMCDRWPPEVKLLDLNLDTMKGSVVFKVRGDHFGSVSDAVSALSAWPRLQNVRARQSQRIQNPGQTFVEFSLEAGLR